MSTKTTFKRIALATVAALGFGVLTSVAPATAAVPADKTLVSAVSFGATTQSSRATVARVGVSTSNTVNITVGSNFTAAAATEIDTFVNFKSVPAGETVLGVSAASTGGPVLTTAAIAAGSLAAAAVTPTVVNQNGVTPGKIRIAMTTGSAIFKGSSVGIGTATWTPAVVGTYVLQAWVDDATAGNTDGTKDAAERAGTKTVVVGGTPTTIVATKLNAGAAVGTANTPGSNEGVVYQVSVTDAAGNKTSFLPGEAIGVTLTSGTGTISDASLTAADFNVYGYAYVTITGSADLSGALTFAASGFTATSIGTSYTATLANAQAASVTLTQTTGLSAGSGIATSVNTAQTGNAAVTFATGKAVTLRVTSGSAASATSRVAAISVADDSGDVTGDLIGTVNYSVAVAIDDTLGYGSVTLPTSGVAAGDSITVSWVLTDGNSKTLVLTAADVALNALSTLSPATASIVTGGGIELTAQALDAYGQAVPNAAVSWSVAGRNVTTTPTQKLADANGYSTYTLTDASTSTTSLTDTVSATITYGATSVTKTSTITWGAGNAVSAIAVTTSPTKTVATTESTISTAATGPEAGAVTLAFTVTDVNGVAINGTPVTFSANSTNVAFKSSATDTANRKLVYTTSTGVATTYVAGWVTGPVVVTATAGTKSVTTTINFVAGAASARTIAVTNVGSLAVATVKDRFGNPVSGVTVNWSRTGTGYFGNGTTATTGVTNAEGVAEISVTGEATVKGLIDVATYTQADDLLGYVGTTATSGTGATLAPAGIASATVSVVVVSEAATAADAAAEATDAANAATDAANAAAEAADAATAAAQDAADAVAALSTQVSEMVNALKKQITALTNLVIKIQKKVRA
jgi:hypothetical protein